MSETRQDAKSELSEYEVTAIEHSNSATSGESATVLVVEAESREDAHEQVKQKSGVKRVERDLTIERQTNEDGRNVY